MTSHDIIKRLEAAKGAIEDPFERERFVDAARLEDGDLRRLLRDALSPSLSAIGSAIALVERLKPGAKIMVNNWPGGDLPAAARVGRDSDDARGATPAIALLLALFRSIEAGK